MGLDESEFVFGLGLADRFDEQEEFSDLKLVMSPPYCPYAAIFALSAAALARARLDFAWLRRISGSPA